MMGEQSKINGKMVVKQQIEEEGADEEEFAVISEVSVAIFRLWSRNLPSDVIIIHLIIRLSWN